MKSRLNTTLGVICLSAISLIAKAQTDTAAARRGPYAVVLTVGGGLSYYATKVGVPPALEQVRASRWGVPATFRAMWYPDHRLRIGLETGWTTLYSYRGVATGERAQVYVSAVPVLIVFSMPLGWLSEASPGTIERTLARRLSLTGGTGAYLLNSRLAYGGVVNNNRISLGWMAAGSYTQPISQRFRIATELKWYNATATEDATFIWQLQLVWRAFSW